ncbi:hypothetical protein VOH94_002883 [Clostridium perfringens]
MDNKLYCSICSEELKDLGNNNYTCCNCKSDYVLTEETGHSLVMQIELSEDIEKYIED